MDKSEQYIKMCENASNIQLEWEIQNGDFVYTRGDKSEGGLYLEGVYVVWNERLPLSGYHNWDDNWYLPSCHWLPRQDQLQEILDRSSEKQCYCNVCLLEAFTKFSAGEEAEKQYLSMEHLWIRFIMWNNYKKKWNGLTWINNQDKTDEKIT